MKDFIDKLEKNKKNMKEGQGYFGVIVDKESVACVGIGKTSQAQRALVIITLRDLADKIEMTEPKPKIKKVCVICKKNYFSSRSVSMICGSSLCFQKNHKRRCLNRYYNNLEESRETAKRYAKLTREKNIKKYGITCTPKELKKLKERSTRIMRIKRKSVYVSGQGKAYDCRDITDLDIKALELDVKFLQDELRKLEKN